MKTTLPDNPMPYEAWKYYIKYLIALYDKTRPKCR